MRLCGFIGCLLRFVCPGLKRPVPCVWTEPVCASTRHQVVTMRHREGKSLLTRSRRLGSSPISPLPLLLFLFPAVAPLVRLLPSNLCRVRPAQPRARRHVEVVATDTPWSAPVEAALRPTHS